MTLILNTFFFSIRDNVVVVFSNKFLIIVHRNSPPVI